jgi:hypothetical protein
VNHQSRMPRIVRCFERALLCQRFDDYVKGQLEILDAQFYLVHLEGFAASFWVEIKLQRLITGDMAGLKKWEAGQNHHSWANQFAWLINFSDSGISQEREYPDGHAKTNHAIKPARFFAWGGFSEHFYTEQRSCFCGRADDKTRLVWTSSTSSGNPRRASGWRVRGLPEKGDDLDRHIYLRSPYDTDGVLFYRPSLTTSKK